MGRDSHGGKQGLEHGRAERFSGGHRVSMAPRITGDFGQEIVCDTIFWGGGGYCDFRIFLKKQAVPDIGENVASLNTWLTQLPQFEE